MEGLITVTLQTITDVKYDVKVTEMSKVEELKNELYMTTGIKNKIRLLKDKEQLDNGKLLRHYKIIDGSVIQMLIVPSQRLKINIKVFKKGNVSLEVSDNDTIEDLREKLKAKEYCLGSAPMVYDFYYSSQKLESEKPLHFYGLCEGTNIALKSQCAKLRLFLNSAQCYWMIKILDVKGTDTVANITNRVAEVISEVEGIDVKSGDIVLFHSPKEFSEIFNELDCETLTVNDYHIAPYDRLTYIAYNLPETTCYDIEYDGDKSKIYNLRQEGVCSLMLKIQDQFGIPVGKQKLTIPGIEEPSPEKEIPSLENITLELLA